jgi:SAM-dependent methyltransferase
MSDAATREPTATLIGRAMQSRVAVAVLDAAPVPLPLVRPWMLRDNHVENGRGSWQRLRHRSEAARYAAVRATTEAYAEDGFVLDVGCSQGILQEGLRYRRYLGVDSYPDAIAKAQTKTDASTTFVCAEGTTYVAEQPPDAVVLSEVVYYLPDPLATVQHYARQVQGGVVIVSVYARSWSSRRLLRRLADRLELVESRRVESGHLAWTIAVFRPRLD